MSIGVFSNVIRAKRNRRVWPSLLTSSSHNKRYNARKSDGDMMYATRSLHRAVQQYPERIATRLAGRARCFREFVHRVAQLTGALQQLGMQEGDRVAMNFLSTDLSRSTP
ncbi:hypothetical protein [Paraburkholderia sp. BL17N1]|uniref:hypothetical protein n=1 Tax=Paraburkholderia sp. BL17N1 TaxID=1938798 RepID=UPI0013150B4F|nr:hypothetical protein [Paraburkholderia sp. BL17N1]